MFKSIERFELNRQIYLRNIRCYYIIECLANLIRYTSKQDGSIFAFLKPYNISVAIITGTESGYQNFFSRIAES